jgi:hypothetical protein
MIHRPIVNISLKIHHTTLFHATPNGKTHCWYKDVIILTWEKLVNSNSNSVRFFIYSYLHPNLAQRPITEWARVNKRYDTIIVIIILHVHPLLGNRLLNKFPRRQILGKQSVARLRRIWGGCVFYFVCATPSAGNGQMISQSDRWHVFSVGFVPRRYKRIVEWDLTWFQESFLVEFRGSRETEQEMARRLHSDLKC